MKKLTRKSLITIITVMVLFVVLGTATFAWITINNMASVRGMRMEVDTTNALQIEEETEIVEANFTNTIVNPANGQIKYLQPVSSVDGKDFFYTQYLLTGVDGNGQLNKEAKLSEYDEEDFAMLYENVYPDLYAQDKKVQGYAEYTFILKAYASTNDVKVYLTDIELRSQDSNAEAKAFRVAVLTKELAQDGTFAGSEYVSKGILTYKEGTVGRSIKNNQELLAFGKTTAGDIKMQDDTTVKMYKTNYGTVLFSADGTSFFTDAKLQNAYTLKAATDDDARIQLGAATTLRLTEKVVGISDTHDAHDGSKYEFKTNRNNVVYGNNPESARNDKYYTWETENFEAVTLEAGETIAATVSTETKVIGTETKYEFTTSENRKVYGDDPDSENNTSYSKYNPTGWYEYEMLTDEETLGASTGEAILLNGIKYYSFKTSLDRVLYCASNTGNAPLFLGNKVAEQENEEESFYDEVKEFDATEELLALNQGDTGYVLVTLRIWVEGEDQDCTNSTFVTLGKDYVMNVKFGLEEPAEQIYLG